MLCHNCGDVSKFCPKCGHELQAPGHTPTSNPGCNKLLDTYSQPTPLFDKYVAAIFDAYDSKVEPKNTGRLEASKLYAIHTDLGRPDGDSWESLLLGDQNKLYSLFVKSGIEAELVDAPGSERLDATQSAVANLLKMCGHGQNVTTAVTRQGYRQSCLEAIVEHPAREYGYFRTFFQKHGITLPLTRDMFPAVPDPCLIQRKQGVGSQQQCVADKQQDHAFAQADVTKQNATGKQAQHDADIYAMQLASASLNQQARFSAQQAADMSRISSIYGGWRQVNY